MAISHTDYMPKCGTGGIAETKSLTVHSLLFTANWLYIFSPACCLRPLAFFRKHRHTAKHCVIVSFSLVFILLGYPWALLFFPPRECSIGTADFAHYSCSTLFLALCNVNVGVSGISFTCWRLHKSSIFLCTWKSIPYSVFVSCIKMLLWLH